MKITVDWSNDQRKHRAGFRVKALVKSAIRAALAEAEAFKGKPTEDLCKAAFYLFHLAFETTDGSKEAVAGILDRMTATLNHAYDHYRSVTCR